MNLALGPRKTSLGEVFLCSDETDSLLENLVHFKGKYIVSICGGF